MTILRRGKVSSPARCALACVGTVEHGRKQTTMIRSVKQRPERVERVTKTDAREPSSSRTA